jgi:hypothetical protein
MSLIGRWVIRVGRDEMMKISNFKLGIAVPLNFPMVPSDFFDSFIAMEKPNYVYLRSSAGHIDAMRNELVQEALMLGCSHIIMMDSDQIYDSKTITRLLSHRLPIVGCLVYRRYPPFDPIIYRGAIDSYQGITEWEEGSLIEVDATGTGCLLFETHIFRDMPYPWFRFRQRYKGDLVGEDIGFCHDLREKGYKIYVDTSVPAGHLTRMIVSDGTWKLYSRVKEAEMKAKHEIEHGISVTKTE